MGTSAMSIDRWRTAHPQETITGPTLCRILGLANLADANLGYANLAGANLRYADLRDTNLGYADLRDTNLAGANLGGADLAGADLRYANLRGAKLADANLRYANLGGADLGYASGGILQVTGLHPYQAYMVPTTEGWTLTVGCWTGTTTELRELIAGDDWPEATGAEQDRRRPILTALADLCDTHATYHADALKAVQDNWAGADQ